MAQDEIETVVDLFGNERYLTPRKRGRPPFERTDENARKVSLLLAMGWSNDRIAGCILDPRTGKPISVPTLKRHFRSELQIRGVARDQLTAKRMMMAMEAAEGGNVGAQRLLEQLLEKNDMMLAANRLAKGGEDDDDDGKIGKKAAARKAADELVSGDEQGTWGSDLKPGWH